MEAIRSAQSSTRKSIQQNEEFELISIRSLQIANSQSATISIPPQNPLMPAKRMAKANFHKSLQLMKKSQLDVRLLSENQNVSKRDNFESTGNATDVSDASRKTLQQNQSNNDSHTLPQHDSKAHKNLTETFNNRNSPAKHGSIVVCT
jgi:hypothetical protein